MTATIITFRSRENRDDIRSQAVRDAAFKAAIATGDLTPEWTAALAKIGAQFNKAASINRFKRQIERVIKAGVCDSGNRFRYGARAAALRDYPLAIAIKRVNRWHDEAQSKFDVAEKLGKGTRLELEVLIELRLLLRMIRKGKHRILGAPAALDVDGHYAAIFNSIAGEQQYLEAAE